MFSYFLFIDNQKVSFQRLLWLAKQLSFLDIILFLFFFFYSCTYNTIKYSEKVLSPLPIIAQYDMTTSLKASPLKSILTGDFCYKVNQNSFKKLRKEAVNTNSQWSLHTVTSDIKRRNLKICWKNLQNHLAITMDVVWMN